MGAHLPYARYARLKTRNRSKFPHPRNKELAIIAPTPAAAHQWLEKMIDLAEEHGLDTDLFPEPQLVQRVGNTEQERKLCVVSDSFAPSPIIDHHTPYTSRVHSPPLLITTRITHPRAGMAVWFGPVAIAKLRQSTVVSISASVPVAP